MTRLRPLTWILPSGLDTRGKSARRITGFKAGLLERAATNRRRAGARMLVHDEPLDAGRFDHLDAAERYMALTEQADAWMSRPLEIRPSRISAVR